MSEEFNPFLKRMATHKGIGMAGRRSEKDTAKKLKGKSTMASGALEQDKGDIKITTTTWDILMECKSTKNESLGVKLEWLAKIAAEALEQNKTPAFAITFTNDHGVSVRNGEWVAVPQKIFREMINE